MNIKKCARIAHKYSLLLFSGILLMSSCSANEGPAKGDSTSYTTSGKDSESLTQTSDSTSGTVEKDPLEGYNLELYTTPFWKGDTVYHEAVTFIQSEDGKLEAPLFYKSDVKIIAVYDMSLSKKYVEGKDFIYEDGMLKLTANTSCPYYRYNEFYPTTNIGNCNLADDKQGYVKFEPDNDMGHKQLSVTYTHSDSYNGFIPEYKGNLLPKTTEKLKNKEQLTIVFYGDSITEGYGSSQKIPCEPRMPIYPSMFTSYLKQQLGARVRYINTALGGTGIDWAYDNVDKRVSNMSPDLVILAFGMNDNYYSSTSDWTAKLKQVMDKILASNPDCEFILVSTTWANPEVDWANNLQPEFEKEMLKLEGNGVAVAQITSLHESIMNGKKRIGHAGVEILGYVDTSGNNYNHPNDFFTRMYTQALCATLIEGYR